MMGIVNESTFFQKVDEWTGEAIYFERIEPSNESGFPDTYFVVRTGFMLDHCEGTIEFKFFKPNEKLDLSSSKTKGTQKAALIDYYQAGGRRRWFIAMKGTTIYMWPTWKAVDAILGKEVQPHTYLINDLFLPEEFRKWMLEVLSV